MRNVETSNYIKNGALLKSHMSKKNSKNNYHEKTTTLFSHPGNFNSCFFAKQTASESKSISKFHF